tara:strand:- start:305 stop:508 length:204 start_codon:yes stop_codon:yes gene_type:complete
VIKNITAKRLCMAAWCSTEKAVNNNKNRLGVLHLGIEKKKYDVIILDNMKSAWYGVSQYCDNDCNGP